MSKTTGVRLVLGLLLLGWTVAAVPARADEPAKELTESNATSWTKEAPESNDQAIRMYRDRQYAAATELMEKALAIRRRLYPADKYDGHPDLAMSLDNLGTLLQTQGEYDKAEAYYREALAMRKRMYPLEMYPDGNPDLARSFNNLGDLLKERGEYALAEPLYREALDLSRALPD